MLAAKFDWDDELLHEVERDIRSYTNLTTPAQTLDVIHADPSDNRILECAIAANSDFIVTGDTRHILPLVRYAGIPIVKVAEFLKRLGEINE